MNQFDILGTTSRINNNIGLDVRLTLCKSNIDIYGTFKGVSEVTGINSFKVLVKIDTSNLILEFKSTEIKKFKVL